jgi:uncharacterized membrane protein
MNHVAPRNPLLGLIRLLALVWVLLSLLGVVVGLIAILYAGAHGCVGNAQGWFWCTAATGLIAISALGSLFTALVVLFFAHLFYLGGAKVTTVEPKRRSLRGFLVDVIADILD